MSRLSRHPLIALGTIVVFAVIGLVLFRLSTGAKTDPVRSRVITVGIAPPIRQDLDIRLAYTADISPYQVVNIFSRVDGYISKLHVDKGDFVKTNQLLVEIDHTDYHHAVNQAKANLSAAKAKVAQQDAVVRNAKLTFDRMQALIKDQFVSQQDLDRSHWLSPRRT
jgi:multidrug efflux pump subunit AcrA (membrane-fusion protein)